MTWKRLSKEEFAAALQRGQGRALLHVRACGLEDVSDLVLEACLHDQAYDPQSEGSRAKWLLGMFHGTAEYKRFSEAILSALANEKEIWDLQQLCELAAQMAAKGDEEAHSALRSRVLRQAAGSEDSWVGADELVRLDGIDAAVELARCYGDLLIQDPEEDPPTLDQLYDDDVPIEARQILQELSDVDAKIKAYWDYVMRYETMGNDNLNSRDNIREQIRRQFPLQKILDDATAGFDEYLGQFMSFGKTATPEELEIIFQRLLAETDEQICLRLLWVFRRTRLPRLDPRIWQFAASGNEQVRGAAIAALAQCQDHAIGEFARDILLSGRFKDAGPEALDLFIRNYQSGDGALIVSTLMNTDSTTEWAHSIGFSVLDICDENYAPELSDALCWVYENTPCAICRKTAVKLLVKFGTLTTEMVEESFCDANEEIQEIVAGLCHG